MVDEENPQDKSKELLAKMQAVLSEASGQDQKPFLDDIPKDIFTMVTKPSETPVAKNGSPSFKTGTFLDEMFLGIDGKSIDGLPSVSNTILTGLPNSGKSQLIKEIALKVASQDKKVVLVTSEEIWSTENSRHDLESRFREMSNILKLDWSKVVKNLFIVDTVAHAELRNWGNFVSIYRVLAEKEKVDLVLIDSMTLLEDSRGQIKNRVLELMRYNQLHGITSILVNQRAIEESDTLAMAGGLGLSHIVDIVFVLDMKKISSWDSAMKQDIGEQAKQGSVINFFRILKCRLGRFDAHYFKYSIDENGFVRLDRKT